MTTITIPKKELETLVKKSIREVLNQELMKFRTLLLPLVSLKEQKDIERRYGKPSRKGVKSVEIKH
ncbi:hypothetical protein KKA96_02815 [Patescibacteria group bacterium]|nr:hypothetical protein [Patescibacteria group bacterium]